MTMTVLGEIQRLRKALEDHPESDAYTLAYNKKSIDSIRRALLRMKSLTNPNEPNQDTRSLERLLLIRREQAAIEASKTARVDDSSLSYEYILEMFGGYVTRSRNTLQMHHEVGLPYKDTILMSKRPLRYLGINKVPQSIIEASSRETHPASITINLIRTLAKLCSLEAMLDSELTHSLDLENPQGELPPTLTISLGAKSIVLDFHVDTASAKVTSVNYTSAYAAEQEESGAGEAGKDAKLNAKLIERRFQNICNRLFPFNLNVKALSQATPYEYYQVVCEGHENIEALVDFQRDLIHLSILDSLSDKAQSDCIEVTMGILYSIGKKINEEYLKELVIGALIIYVDNKMQHSLHVRPLVTKPKEADEKVCVDTSVFTAALSPPLVLTPSHVDEISAITGPYLLGTENVSDEGLSLTYINLTRPKEQLDKLLPLLKKRIDEDEGHDTSDH